MKRYVEFLVTFCAEIEVPDNKEYIDEDDYYLGMDINKIEVHGWGHDSLPLKSNFFEYETIGVRELEE